MKKMAMILAVAFTMGLGASTVSATTKDKKAKAKTECPEAKKADCPKKEAKGCCADKKAEAKK